MPSCQAFNCTNEKGKCSKSFFVIPDPEKSAEKKKLCKLWITNLKNGKLQIETFKYNNSKVVCEDHFTPDSFKRNLVKESINFIPKRKQLRPNAVPTIVNTGTPVKKPRQRSEISTKKHQQAQVKEQLMLSIKKTKTTPEETVVSADITDEQGIQLQTPEANMEQYAQDLSVPSVLPSPCQTELPLNNDEDVRRLLQSCGHPCMMCLQANNMDSSILTADHSYTKSQASSTSTRSVGVNTDDSDMGAKHMTSSTPIKLPDINSTPIKFDNELLDSSFRSNSFCDDSNDLTFDIDMDCDSSDNDSTHTDSTEVTECDTQSSITDQRKFIVFESQLDQLFARLKCHACNCPVDLSDTVKECSSGTILRVSIFCTNGHLIYKWLSQPLIGNMPAGNLLVSAATLFCGQTYTHIAQFAEFMNLKFIGKSTFTNIQRDYLMPVIQHTWSVIQGKLLDKVKTTNRTLRLAGDGRCDSPGFSAKYCTYSLLDMETQHILAFVTIKVTETGSSCKMEVEGFRRCMEYLLDKGFQIVVLATDRHVQIRSVMKKQYTEIEHQFDVWHLANSFRKKLQAKSKLRGAEDLGPWIKAICNHLWWCASNCNGDKEWLEENCVSIVHHVVNEHTFEGKIVTTCAHEPITSDMARTKKWMTKGSKAHNALKEVILNKRLRNDIKHLSEFCHTGNLEVYHSLMLKYVPKRQEFDADQMDARTTLAVIDHNMSQNRGKKTDSQGQEVYKTAYSKGTGKWVAKPVYNKKSYKWVGTMMKMCVLQKEQMLFQKIDTKNHGNIAPIPAPVKSELVQNLISRFNKTCD